MRPEKIQRNFIMPTMVPVIAFVIAAVIIIAIGEALLHLNKPDTAELKRLELWVATGLSIVILAVCAFIATRPKGSLGPLDEEVVFGDRRILDQPLPPVDVRMRSGQPGTIADLKPGMVLYARNGALAKVVDVLPNVAETYGHLRKGLIYATGLYGADKELWIPIEALSGIYPETGSAFLAIGGDETAALGWNQPPASFSRKAPKEEPKLY